MKKLLSFLFSLVATTAIAQNVHTFKSDVGGKTYINKFPIIQDYFPAQGISNSGTTVTNYPVTALDSTQQFYGLTNPYPSGGSKYGGIMYNEVPGLDSFYVSAVFGILGGSSFSASHSSPLSYFSRLEGTNGNGGALFQYNYIDSPGTLAYYMRQQTGYRWYPQAIGGQTTHQFLERFARDVLGISINGVLDSRGNSTISRKPYILFFDGIGNDPYATGATPQGTINDLIHLAQLCKEYNIKFIVSISTSTSGVSVAGDTYVQSVNKWLTSGGLDAYGVVLFDMRTFWSNPAWGYDGTHGNPNYIDQNDFTHFQIPKNSGQVAGYDSLAIAIVTQCRVPILTKIIFNTNLAPSNPVTQLNYISAATIDGQAYTIPNQNDTFALLRPLGNGTGPGGTIYDCGDTVCIKATGVTAIAGSGNNYGVGAIYWYLDNTNGGTDTTNTFTRRTLGFNSGETSDIQPSTITIYPITNNGSQLLINVLNPTWSGQAFGVYGSGTNYALINGPTYDGTSALQVNGNISTTSHSVISLGGNSEFGNLQIGFTAIPSAFGAGIGTVNGGECIYFLGSASYTQPLLSFNAFATRQPTFGNSGKHFGLWNDSTGYGAISGNAGADTIPKLEFIVPINDTFYSKQPAVLGGIEINQTNIALGIDRPFAFWNELNDNWFNSQGGHTGFGTDHPDPTAKVDISDTARGFLPPRMTTTQRNNIGGVSIGVSAGGSSYTSAKGTISGGSGSGARCIVNISGGAVTSVTMVDNGINYGSSLPTLALSNVGSGTGATFTYSHVGPHDGLIIYNITVDSTQQYNSTCSCWLDLQYASAAASIQGTNVTVVGDANYTIASGDKAVIYNTALTANRTITLPNPAGQANRSVHVVTEGDIFSSGTYQFNISTVSGTANIYFNSHSGATSVATNVANISLIFYSDGTSWYGIEK